MKKLTNILLLLLVFFAFADNSFGMNREKNISKKSKKEATFEVYKQFKFLKTVDLKHHGQKTTSKDGNLVVSAGDDKQVKVYDMQKQKVVCSYAHEGQISFVSISPDGEFVASGEWDNDNVKIYQVKTGKEVPATSKYFNLMRNWATHERFFSPNGNFFLSITFSGGKGKVTIYNVKSMKEVCSYQHDNKIRCASFSRDGNFIVSAGHDKKVILYDIKNNKEVWSFVYEGHADCISLSPDGNFILLGLGVRVMIFDIQKKKVIYSYTHKDLVTYACFTSDDKKIISVDYNGQVKINKTSCGYFLYQKRYKNKKRTDQGIKNNIAKRLSDKKLSDVLIKTYVSDDFDFSIDEMENVKKSKKELVIIAIETLCRNNISAKPLKEFLKKGAWIYLHEVPYALEIACEKKNLDIIKLLIENGRTASKQFIEKLFNRSFISVPQYIRNYLIQANQFENSKDKLNFLTEKSRDNNNKRIFKFILRIAFNQAIQNCIKKNKRIISSVFYRFYKKYDKNENIRKKIKSAFNKVFPEENFMSFCRKVIDKNDFYFAKANKHRVIYSSNKDFNERIEYVLNEI